MAKQNGGKKGSKKGPHSGPHGEARKAITTRNKLRRAKKRAKVHASYGMTVRREARAQIKFEKKNRTADDRIIKRIASL